MIIPGEIWQHNTTHEIAKVVEERGGLLSFSFLRKGKWELCPHVWDDEQFAAKFTKLSLREVFPPRED